MWRSIAYQDPTTCFGLPVAASDSKQNGVQLVFIVYGQGRHRAVAYVLTFSAFAKPQLFVQAMIYQD